MNDLTISADFLRMTCAAIVRQTSEMLRLANRRFWMRSVLDVLTTAPKSFSEASNREFRDDSFCCQCLADAYRMSWNSHEERMAYESVKRFFDEDIPSLSAPARQALEAVFHGIVPGLELAEHFREAERLRYHLGELDVKSSWIGATP